MLPQEFNYDMPPTVIKEEPKDDHEKAYDTSYGNSADIEDEEIFRNVASINMNPRDLIDPGLQEFVGTSKPKAIKAQQMVPGFKRELILLHKFIYSTCDLFSGL